MQKSKNNKKQAGRFITLEGGEGAGKSTPREDHQEMAGIAGTEGHHHPGAGWHAGRRGVEEITARYT